MIVITLGTFDTLHLGHIKLIKFCKSLGETVVGLNTDEFVEKYKGKRPVMSYLEREAVIREFDVSVIRNDQPNGSILEVLEVVRPDIIVIGSDWGRKDYLKQLGITWEDLEQRGISLCYYPRSLNMSTTLIKQRIKEL